MIYEKLLRLGSGYSSSIKTSEAVQMTVEGVEQLETYFGAYLPQFFYAMLAPITLFAVLSFVDFLSAALLLCCVPLIPAAIIAVQRWAKRLLSKYWGQYTALGVITAATQYAAGHIDLQGCLLIILLSAISLFP